MSNRQKMLKEKKKVATKIPGDQVGPSAPKAQASQQTSGHLARSTNNKLLVLCFLDDVPKAKECRQCHIEFPRRKQIIPYDVILSHEEKWSYPDPQQPGRKLPSTKYTTKHYCVKGSCIKTRFPYYDSSLLQIPPEASSRLQKSHLDLLNRELDFEEQSATC